MKKLMNKFSELSKFKRIMLIMGIILFVLASLLFGGAQEKQEQNKEKLEKAPQINKMHKENKSSEQKSNEFSEGFKEDVANYLDNTANVYIAIGKIDDVATNDEALDIVLDAQNKYLSDNEIAGLDPKTDKDFEVYQELLEIDSLTISSTDKVTDGLMNNDVEEMNEAVKDINEVETHTTKIQGLID